MDWFGLDFWYFLVIKCLVEKDGDWLMVVHELGRLGMVRPGNMDVVLSEKPACSCVR